MEAVRRLKHNLDIFEPVNFEMFVQQKYKLPTGEQQEDRLHTYTQAVESPLGGDLHFNDWSSFAQEYPLLAAMATQKPLDCNVIAADASVGFPTESFKDQPHIELGISFVCTSHHLSPNARVRYRYSFYRKGQRVAEEDHDAPIQLSEPAHQYVTTSLKFGSSFWARLLHSLSHRLQKEAVEGDGDASEEVRDVLSGITAILEVIVVSPQHDHERILVMCWTFRKSSVATGRASWRRINVPSQTATQYQEPAKPERTDSLYDYATSTQYVEIPAASQLQQPPALQSPFEYESSSGSALSSATWPTSFSEGSVSSAQAANIGSLAADNSFDFNGGNINLNYDPLDFSFFDGNFDSSTFNLDSFTTTNTEAAYDPSLDAYPQQWIEGYADDLEAEQAALSAVTADTSFGAGTQVDVGGSQALGAGYAAQYDEQIYAAPMQEQQAYGGAGPDGFNDDALAALADASCMMKQQSLSEVP
ncbi:hypothetical protein BAUCODRAFT_31209 [Baudoinia panamericana UAMH 10762]|uniref:TEA domain-containing protein n=1 Tax=Baudoinia panamericana (strain UAMH 10762) TaxID=717646 RepID=M2N4M4_BAUPA|nr:uncharacterized protein BAUCODRAFT_31209 [Baudoinia panamericana UAMH 10762]EMC98933.1 hypothetical protein BAUCODRAFT_31209 [Baudoinia panamericana UAMH 10762]